jgi:hypothetical protein
LRYEGMTTTRSACPMRVIASRMRASSADVALLMAPLLLTVDSG